MSDKPTYSKQIIEIADYIFANPLAKKKDVLAYFGVFWRKRIASRTFDRLWKRANDYNKSRVQAEKKAKDEVLVAEAKEAVKRAILTRDESLEILSDIAKGSARKIKVHNSIFVPSDSERTRAITVLANIQGWNEPAKQEITGKDGKDLIPSGGMTREEIMAEIKRIKTIRNDG